VGIDNHGRVIDYLRISVTDRCNLRCVYCMPEEGIAGQPHSEILTYEEIFRVAKAAANAGLTRIRLTGGEPLVRKGLIGFVGRLMTLDGVEVALTTNGTLLSRYAERLRAAGLSRVNVSLDSLDPETYRRLTRWGDLSEVLEGIEAAVSAGLDPVKINVVVVRSLRQDLIEFARLTQRLPVHVRFIEYMPVGTHPLWGQEDFVSADEVRAEIEREFPLAWADKPTGWGPARYCRIEGAPGSIGFITPRSSHFCAECNRLRLTADGKIRTCLFSDDMIDVRSVLRADRGNEALTQVIAGALANKPKERPEVLATVRSMSQIGG
jgi:GTP 3',8-cyclase